MPKVLIVTNDFPPRAGGIQSFIHALATRLPADGVVVYAPAWAGAAEFDRQQPFPVLRHPTSLMLPVPSVRARAVPRADRARLRQGAVRRGRAARPAGAPRCARPGPGGSSRSPTATRRAGPRCPARAPCCAGSATRWTWSPTWASTSGSGWPGRCPRPRRPGWSGWPPAWTPPSSSPGAGGAAIRAQLGLARPPGGGLRVPDGARKGQDTLHPGLARGPGARRRPAAAAGRRRPVPGRAGPAGQRLGRGGLGALHRPGAAGRPARLLRRRRRVRDAVPDPPRRPRRGGPRHRLPGGVRDRAAGHRRRLRRRAGRDPATARPATSCRAATSRPWRTGSSSCSPTRPGPGAWATRAWPGSTANGAGTWSRSGCSSILAG